GGAAVGSEAVGGLEPSDGPSTTDDAGSEDRPDAGQVDEEGLRPLDGFRQRGVGCGDLAVEMSDLAHERGGELAAGGARALPAADASKELGGSIGGEGCAGASVDEMREEGMEAVHDLGSAF